MSIRQALNQATEYLESQGIKESRLDVQVLLAYVLNISRSELLAHPDDPLDTIYQQELNHILARRIHREPVAYITGKKEFYGLDFQVTPDTLIPRPETELLVETALKITGTGTKSVMKTMDIGTGCGAIAVSLAVHLSQSNLYATDISSSALKVARQNAIRHNVVDKIAFIQGDLLTPFRSLFDLIVANLPYVTDAEFHELDHDIRKHEPVKSLAGGKYGIDSIYRLLSMAGECICPGGSILLEIGYDQSNLIKDIGQRYFPEGYVDIIKDFNGNDRVAMISL